MAGMIGCCLQQSYMIPWNQIIVARLTTSMNSKKLVIPIFRIVLGLTVFSYSLADYLHEGGLDNVGLMVLGIVLIGLTTGSYLSDKRQERRDEIYKLRQKEKLGPE